MKPLSKPVELFLGAGIGVFVLAVIGEVGEQWPIAFQSLAAVMGVILLSVIVVWGLSRKRRGEVQVSGDCDEEKRTR